MIRANRRQGHCARYLVRCSKGRRPLFRERICGFGGTDEVEDVGPGMDLLRVDEMVWATSRAHGWHERDPVPVALFDRACWWRDVALKALHASGRAYRIVYTSESVQGVAAAIRAGIAIGVLNASALSDDLVALEAADGFGRIPPSKLVLQTARHANDPASLAMASAIKRAFATNR